MEPENVTKGLFFKQYISSELTDLESGTSATDTINTVSITAKNISGAIYEYKLANENGDIVGNPEYLLQVDEFLNCFGDISKVNTSTFTEEQMALFEDENYFDVADDASYQTQQDYTQTAYPSQEDLETEIANLPDISQTSDVPVSVVNQYLTAINSFYDKQMHNMLYTPYQYPYNSLQIDNDSMDVVASNYFIYDASNYFTEDTDNSYECVEAVTGSDNFKYCGPTPYINETYNSVEYNTY